MAAANYGKQKVLTLRSVARAQGNNVPKDYMHNGCFTSLKAVVHFYNTRDTKPQCPDAFTTEKDALATDCWPVAEVPGTVNHEEPGKLRLTPEEEDAIVAFLKTLYDRYFDPTRWRLADQSCDPGHSTGGFHFPTAAAMAAFGLFCVFLPVYQNCLTDLTHPTCHTRRQGWRQANAPRGAGGVFQVASSM
jgi:hypothetical protein